MKKLFVLMLFALFLFGKAFGQRFPSYHERGDLMVMAGYQNLRLQAGLYQAYSINCECIVNNTYSERLTIGVKGDMAFGRNYISFAPVGLLINAALPLCLSSAGDSLSRIAIGIGALSSLQFHFPICHFLEVNGGWNTFRITRLKNLGDTYYIDGGIGVGLGLHLGNVVINPYYEYNYNYYGLSNKFNEWFDCSIEYPQWFNGHTFGVRIGFRFNNAWGI